MPAVRLLFMNKGFRTLPLNRKWFKTRVVCIKNLSSDSTICNFVSCNLSSDDFPSNTLTPHSLYPGELCRSENLSSGCFFCVVMLKEGNIYCAKGRTLTKAECGFSNLFLLPSRSIQFCSTYAVKGKVEICDTCSISMLSDQF